MTRTITPASLALLLTMVSAQGAHAQARGAAPAARPAAAAAAPAAGANAITGAPIPGVCIFSNDRALQSSLVGQAAANRMQQIRAQVSAELSGEQTTLRTDLTAFDGKRTTLTPQQQQAQAAPLQQRAQAFENKVALRNRELDATGAKALQRISEQLAPIVTSVSASRNCSLVLSGDGAVMAANPAMDLTPAVVQGLNARMATITFDRENLANQAAAPAARR